MPPLGGVRWEQLDANPYLLGMPHSTNRASRAAPSDTEIKGSCNRKGVTVKTSPFTQHADAGLAMSVSCANR